MAVRKWSVSDEYLVEVDDKFGALPEGLVEQLDDLWPS